MDWENVQTNYIAGTPYVGANVVMKPGPGGNRGEVTAWDPVQAKARLADQGRPAGCGAAPWSPPAISCSTERWTAGSRRSMPRPAR